MRHRAPKKTADASTPILRLPLLLALLAVSANPQPLAPGNLLVATAKSHDPDLAGSVVLLIRYDSESAMGLMLNKPTSVPIVEVLPDAKRNSVGVYAGGPVTIGVRGLLRSKAPPFFTVVSNKAELLRIIASGIPALRIYAGYTGWTAPQLQNEVERGLWKVLPASAGALFDPHPETLWRRVVR
jgi:putative transcriptional regulator